MSFRCFIIFFLSLSICSCSQEYERLVKKADQEARAQKSQLAKYIYLQVIQNHKDKDDVRYRALKGLALTSLNQLFDYEIAVQAFDKIFTEFGQVARYQNEIFDLRLIAATVWRVNLAEPKRALDVLSPVMTNRVFSSALGQELGRIYLALNDYDQARHWLTQTFEKANSNKNCSVLEQTQLDLVQVFVLQGKCNDVQTWASMKLPDACQPDHFSLAIERAHCFEISGDVDRAVALYKNLIEENPDNTRAHFFLESLKRRQKEKQTR